MKPILCLLGALTLGLNACSNDDSINEIDTHTSTISESDIAMCWVDFISPQDQDTTFKPNSVILNHRRWKPGQTITIKFLNGDALLQEKVKKYANHWIAYANLKFKYVSAEESANIRIGFRWEGDLSSWSDIGVSLSTSLKVPSMNFGWLSSNTAESEFQRVVLHEFGHALSLVHEHSSPASNINWNKQAVYDYYQENGALSKSAVDYNFFGKYDEALTNYTKYDPYSIMNYTILPSFTTDGFSTPIRTELSLVDRIFISRMYPKSSNLYVGQRLSLGESITSPDGNYSLSLESRALKIIDNKKPENSLYSMAPRPGSYDVRLLECKLESDRLILRNGNKDKIIIAFGTALKAGDYMAIRNSGDVEIVREEIPVWSLLKGKLIN